MFVFFIETEQLAESIADTSAHLQCSTFTTRRTTEKVCDEGGYKNERCHAKRQFIIGMDGRNDQVGSCIFFVVQQPVHGNNCKTADWQ